MAIPSDMEHLSAIIETDLVKAVIRYGRAGGRRLSKSAAARVVIIAGLRALDALPQGFDEREPAPSEEPIHHIAA